MPVLDDRTDAVSSALAAAADDQAAAIVQTSHARVCARLDLLRNKLDTALTEFGCDPRSDSTTFSANAKALVAVLFGSTPTVDLPNAWWTAEEALVTAAVDDANRGYAIAEQVAPTADLPHA